MLAPQQIEERFPVRVGNGNIAGAYLYLIALDTVDLADGHHIRFVNTTDDVPGDFTFQLREILKGHDLSGGCMNASVIAHAFNKKYISIVDLLKAVFCFDKNEAGLRPVVLSDCFCPGNSLAKAFKTIRLEKIVRYVQLVSLKGNSW